MGSLLRRALDFDPFRVVLEPPAAPGCSATPGPRPDMKQASEARLGTEIGLINWTLIECLSEIKLIRTDTTLDLSQKAEKVCLGRLRTYLS